MVAKKPSGIKISGNRVTPKKDTGVQAGPTSAAEWKQKSSLGTPVRVPSGNVALLKRPGMHVFLAKGMIPNSLMAFVNESIKKGKPNLDDFTATPETMKDLMDLTDAVTIECCIEPKVFAIPTDPKGNQMLAEYREADKLYVDEVDVDDKMFIFNYAVGGPSDVASFRKEFAATMDDLQAG